MIETQDRIYLLSACLGTHHLVKSDLPIPTVYGHQVNMSMIVQKICTTWGLPVYKSIDIPCQGSFILPPERNRTSFLVWIWIEILLTLSLLLMKEWWVEFCQLTPVNAAWKSLMQHGCEGERVEHVWGTRTYPALVSCRRKTRLLETTHRSRLIRKGDVKQPKRTSSRGMKGRNKRIRIETYLYSCKIEEIIMLQKPIRKTGWSLCLADASLVISPFFLFFVKAIRNQSSVKNLGIINMHMMLLIIYWLSLRITVSQIILGYPDFSLSFTSVGLFLASGDPTTQFSTGQKSAVFLKKKTALRVEFYDVDL